MLQRQSALSTLSTSPQRGRLRLSRFQPAHQLSWVDAEGCGQPDQVPDGQVDLAAFDVTNVGAVQPGLVGQAFLRGWRHQGFPMGADASADLSGLLDASSRPWHKAEARPLAPSASTA